MLQLHLEVIRDIMSSRPMDFLCNSTWMSKIDILTLRSILLIEQCSGPSSKFDQTWWFLRLELQSKAKQSNFYLLKQNGHVAAIQLMWACRIPACALRITSGYSFTDLGRVDSSVGCWLVVSGSDDGDSNPREYTVASDSPHSK